MNNPVTAGLAQTAPMAAITTGAGFLMGGPAGALATLPLSAGMLASGAGVGYSQSIRESHPYLSDALAGASIAMPLGMMVGSAFSPVGTAIGGLAGVGLGAIGGLAYGAITGKSAADSAMALLDAPAEVIERFIGTVIQLDLANEQPGVYGTTDEILANLGAAWKAGGMTYETGALHKWLTGQYGGKTLFGNQAPTTNFSLDAAEAMGGYTSGDKSYILKRIMANPINVLPMLNEALVRRGIVKGDLADIRYLGPEETFLLGVSPYPVPMTATGAAAIVEARKLIADGADPQTVLTTYKSIMGLPGLVADTTGHMVLDPWNKVFGEAVGKTGEIGAKIAGQPLLEEAFKLKAGGGIFEKWKLYKELAKFAPTDQLTALDKVMAGIDPNSPTGWAVDVQHPATGNRVVDWARNAFQRTPQAAVEQHINDSQNYVPLMLNEYRRNGDAAGMRSVFAGVSGTPSSAQEATSLRLAGTPMGAAVMRSAKSFLPKFDLDLEEYRSTRTQAAILSRISDILGEDSGTILKRFSTVEDANVLLKDLETRLTEIGDENAMALLEELHPADGSPPRLTADQLKQMVDVFSGDNPAPKDIDEFAARVVSDYTTHSTELLADVMGVKQKPWYYQVTNMLKAVQSAALLSFNAGYVIPHIFLNPATVLASSVGGSFHQGDVPRLDIPQGSILERIWGEALPYASWFWYGWNT